MNTYLEKFCEQTGIDINDCQHISELDIVRNRYYTGMLTTDKGYTDYIYKVVRNKKKVISKLLKKGKIWEAMLNYERPFRLNELINLNLKNFERSNVGEAIRCCWMDSCQPYVNYFVWRSLFDAYKDVLMTKEELKYYNQLPEVIMIHRGTTNPLAEEDSDHPPLSWTLKESVAEKFSHGLFGNDVGRVMSMEINKKDACAYFSGCDESEIIYLPTD